MMARDTLCRFAERAAALVYPRRCPFCGELLPQDAPQAAFCKDCQPEEARLAHTPPRLPGTEHSFYAVSGAACAYYYADAVRSAILLCKRGGRPWYARELADLMVERIWAADPAPRPGERPGCPALFKDADYPVFDAIIPAPRRSPRSKEPSLPLLLAKRLGQILDIPVMTPLRPVRQLLEQKGLSREERLQNTKDAYACDSAVDLSGTRLLLVDDVITTGATVSACAKALLQAGAVDVFAAGIAADEELPKEKQNQGRSNHETAGHRH